MKMLRRFSALSFFMALLALGSEALAQPSRGGGRPPGRPSHGSSGNRHSIPELDPAAAGAIGVVVAGGALLIARRRKR